MSLPRPALSTLLLACAIASSAFAQSGRTRDQVEAEYMEAVRTGNVLVNGEIGMTLRELYPQNYPAMQVQGRTREQVAQELEQAQRTGNILASGERGLVNAANPQQGPSEAVASGKTRAQVKAELREAIRTGNMVASGESSLMLKDLYPERYANVLPSNNGPMQATASPAASKINRQ